MIIRQEKEEDRPAVEAVVASAFENKEHSDHQEHVLVDKLRESRAFVPDLSLVAEVDGLLVGYILFTEIKVGGDTLLALAPVAVLPDWQRRGVGGELIREGHRIAAGLGYKGCVVLGHADYYPRFGYTKAVLFDIKAPVEVPDDYYMAMEVYPGALDDVAGVVEYDEAFGL